ncbi:hypothetical protein DPMN_096301 [Dreissena polymorpha]|uniref:Uncharacterized protein n=1 Tax=Dreissena polymorpha TaxID=45954 RepID=A0A9D4R3N7_DREPO|nr:hypothetical protein DPMN_096301 [Dreissena polymorpha]
MIIAWKSFICALKPFLETFKRPGRTHNVVAVVLGPSSDAFKPCNLAATLECKISAESE